MKYLLLIIVIIASKNKNITYKIIIIIIWNINLNLNNCIVGTSEMTKHFCIPNQIKVFSKQLYVDLIQINYYQ